jgi:L-cysteate sulfo-lyase
VKLPTVSLGFFPTPVCELKRLAEALGGPQIFMKRDDMTGLGLGGNKTRKLEYILGDAMARGCDSVITAGAAQSNHCRQTAAAAAQLGLECHLVLGGEQPENAKGNLLLDHLFACNLHWAGNHRKGEDIPLVQQKLKAAGKKPYVVPYGGSNELGVISFMHAVQELNSQLNLETFSHMVFASGSGGTHAGLILGKKSVNASLEVLGIHVDKHEKGQTSLESQILDLVNRTTRLLRLDYKFSDSDVILDSGYAGEGYGIVSEMDNEAVSLTARLEGILLDPVYTGRAMGGLIDKIRSGAIGKNSRVLFWHTGGAPALFAYSDSLTLNNHTNQIISS